MRVNTEEKETEMKTKLQVKVILSVWQPRLREKLHEEIQSLHDPKPQEDISEELLKINNCWEQRTQIINWTKFLLIINTVSFVRTRTTEFGPTTRKKKIANVWIGIERPQLSCIYYWEVCCLKFSFSICALKSQTLNLLP